jgi:hypothetical protein
MLTSKSKKKLPDSKHQSPTTAALYPHLSAKEQADAEYNLKRYVHLVRRIFERVNRENPKLLTVLLKKGRLKTPDRRSRKIRHS